MERIAKVLDELGLTKVFGILDGDKAHLLDTLRSSFPQFAFEAIPTPDLRGKRAKPESKEKEGLLDPNGQPKSQYVPVVDALRNKVTTYFLS